MDKFEQLLSRFAPQVLSIVRIMTGLLLLQHPLSKFFGFPVATNRPALFALGWFAGAIEIVFGSLFLVGAWTRFVAFILSGELAFAYFIGHAPRGFYPQANAGEAAVLFCFIFLYFACAGGGPWSVDAAMRGKR
ncbi:MAG TPA: DoxX family protein [Xanthobacteraceae bacterium]|nr:DoxX family protein [Xanthobacteraceae bacterium]